MLSRNLTRIQSYEKLMMLIFLSRTIQTISVSFSNLRDTASLFIDFVLSIYLTYISVVFSGKDQNFCFYADSNLSES